MDRRIFLFVFSMFAASIVGACESTKEAPRIPQLVDPSKADGVGDQVNMMGRISFGSAVFGDFTDNAQLDGYWFTAEGGVWITADNTNLGTSRSLDTVLFIYGPANKEGDFVGEPLFYDDDSGWGAHARIKKVLLPERGDYLLVLGTYADMGRGHYRLELRCEEENCTVPCDATCDDNDPCTEDICDPIDGCIHVSAGESCSNGKAILIDGGPLTTDENKQIDSFTVQLTKAPSHHVAVWVESSDMGEAVMHPQKLWFCAAGYHEDSNGCELNENNEDPEEWRCVHTVSVFGVRDGLQDGNVSFNIRFQIETDDQDYQTLSTPTVSGVNLDVALPVDYGVLEGLYDDDLLACLHELLNGHTTYGYLGQNSARTLMFSAVDVRDGFVESLYNGATVYLPRDATSAFQMGFNVEHTWPQGQFDKMEPMKSDLHHIFPTNIDSNSVRSSYDYGMTYDTEATGSILGNSSSNLEDLVYQVRPERRGDVARAHFYMVARYKYDTTIGILFDDDDYSENGCIDDNEEAFLRLWHVEDPVDDMERSRNNRVEAYQGNRNPFIDDPDLVDRISDF